MLWVQLKQSISFKNMTHNWFNKLVLSVCEIEFSYYVGFFLTESVIFYFSFAAFL